MPFQMGGIHVTPGRFIVLLFFVPAMYSFFERGRRWSMTDTFAAAFALWILVSSALNGGFRPYVGAEAIEFYGAYLIGRTFFFGPPRVFLKAFECVTLAVVTLALLDTATGKHFTLDAIGLTSSVSQNIVKNDYRMGFVRAASVFESPEHFGAFCAAAAAIFLYLERGARRKFYVGVSCLGCILALSSGPLMGLCVVAALFCYDKLLGRFALKWKLLSTVAVAMVLAVFTVSAHPIEWIVVHMTFDPQTGFFRLGTWLSALPLVDASPLVGHGLSELGGSGDASIYLGSVDCVWLVEALRYGIPGVILLLLTMISPMLKSRAVPIKDLEAHRTGFSFAIVAMGLIGLTVHFWDASWLFLSLCIGIRASSAPLPTTRARRTASISGSMATEVRHST
jgi:hypothetical protein